jgi:hypothetical protein
MGIQYVIVKVDTSGLYQPLASAAGVVGIIGPAPSSGPGFSNPTLFSRPLIGALGEPYPRVVPVMRVAPLAGDVQTLSISGSPTGGTFTLTFGNQTTAAIPFNATAAQVQTALQALSSIGAGNVACSGGQLPGTGVLIMFQGALDFVAQSRINVGTSSLTGGASPAVAVAHTVVGAARVNDVQTLSISDNPTGGTFTLTFGGQTTAVIPFNATAAQVQTALQALASIGPGNVACTGGPLPGTAVTITFQGALGFNTQQPITISANNLAGPAPAIAHTTTGQGVNDVQTVSVNGNPTGGSFTLSFGGQTTGAIAFNATAGQVQTALLALSTIGAGNIACTGGPFPGNAVTITFQGSLGNAAQPAITIGANNLTGGTTPAPAIVHTTTGAGVDDVQTLSLSDNPTGGTFALTFGGQTTAAIAATATSAQVQAALQALPSIGAGNVACTGGPLPGTPVTITFQGTLADVVQPTIGIGQNNLSGPTPSIVHTTPGVGAASIAVPVDPDNVPIPKVKWDPFLLRLIDTASNATLSVDTSARTLRYSTGAAFQNGTVNAVIALDGFSTASATVNGPPPYWGAPLDLDGQPVLNLLMRPDSTPASAFVDFAGNVLTVDGVLGQSNGGTGKPKGINGSVYYTVSFDICTLAKSVNLALTNGALNVWAFRLDSALPFDGSAAFADFANRDINIVCLSADSNPDDITALKNHVEQSSPNDAGGGGTRPRIGVAMLPMGGITDANGNLTNKFSDWKTLEELQNGLPSPMNWASSRMVFVVANSPDDFAAAAAGVIAGFDPWISLILKPVSGIGINGTFTDGAIQIYIAPDHSNLVQPRVIPILHPDFLAGSGPVMGEGFSADGTGQRLYVDIVRTIDDIAFRLKATLTSAQVIGTLRINRTGLRVLTSIVRAMLRTRVDAGEIDDFTLEIPIQALTEKDPAQLTPEEQQALQQVQNSRQLPLNVSVTYSGAIHQLVVTLKFI